jgi:hypothetical protein
MRNKLLIATTVAALLAATGLAGAQDNHPGSPTSPRASPAQPGPRAQATPRTQPMQQQRMQSQRLNTNRGPTRMGQNEPNRINQGNRLNNQGRQNRPAGLMEQRRGTAQNQQGIQQRRNLAQGRENNRNARLSSDQRNRIRQTVLAQGGAPRLSRRDLGGINIRVGAVIPRNRLRFRPLPLPASVVAIAPQWQGFLYFLVGNEVVVIDPVTYDIVAILPA